MTGARSFSFWVPLRFPLFRRVWLAGSLSNFGTLIQAVGAAWAMAELTDSANLVALVQTASFLPLMLFALVGGAIADLFDRRRAALLALFIAFVSAVALTGFASFGLVTPALLLLLSFTHGCGTALYLPAWQASVREQVPSDVLPAAVGLNSMSYNLARSLGPAVGGVLVASAGATAAFGMNALSFIPIYLVLFFWRVTPVDRSVPREKLNTAINLGLRYVANAPMLRSVVLRAFGTAMAGSIVLALLPLVAREFHGGAITFGLLLGTFGIGGVIGAFITPWTFGGVGREKAIRLTNLSLGASLIVVSLSSSAILTSAALLVSGASWTMTTSTYNLSIQLSAPSWVGARALATYHTIIAAGLALGSWVWGTVAETSNVPTALFGAGAFLVLFQLVGIAIPIRIPAAGSGTAASGAAEDGVDVSVQAGSSPITVLVEYVVQPEQAEAFETAMRGVRLSRRRNGAKGWMLERDAEDPHFWTERFTMANWGDYLRHRDRISAFESAVREASAYHCGESAPRFRYFIQASG
jgi:MFS family permease